MLVRSKSSLSSEQALFVRLALLDCDWLVDCRHFAGKGGGGGVICLSESVARVPRLAVCSPSRVPESVALLPRQAGAIASLRLLPKSSLLSRPDSYIHSGPIFTLIFSLIKDSSRFILCKE